MGIDWILWDHHNYQTWVFTLSTWEQIEEEGLEVNSWIRRGITWTCRRAQKRGDFRMTLGSSEGTWANAAQSGWEKALFQCWETLRDPVRLGIAQWIFHFPTA